METGLELLFNFYGLGIKKIYIHFSGSGDDGAIDSIDYYLENDTVFNNDESHLDTFRNELEKYCYRKILDHVEDWYNNDGGNGTLVIDTKTGEYNVEVNIATYSYETYTHKGNLV